MHTNSPPRHAQASIASAVYSFPPAATFVPSIISQCSRCWTFLPLSQRLQPLPLPLSLVQLPRRRRSPSSMATTSAHTGSDTKDKEELSAAAPPADVYSGELTPLQRHVAFFDRNKDGIIYPAETYEGFRAIGCGVALSAASAVLINGALGPKTIPENEKIPPFKFPIYVKNIHKGKHGSDSGVYDAHGRFVPEKFEEIFKKHAHTRPDALTGKELQELLQANREPKDFKGWVGGYTEWKVLYTLCKDKEGFLHKETVRAVYDGSLFERLEQERKSKKESAKKK